MPPRAWKRSFAQYGIILLLVHHGHATIQNTAHFIKFRSPRFIVIICSLILLTHLHLPPLPRRGTFLLSHTTGKVPSTVMHLDWLTIYQPYVAPRAGSPHLLHIHGANHRANQHFYPKILASLVLLYDTKIRLIRLVTRSLFTHSYTLSLLS